MDRRPPCQGAQGHPAGLEAGRNIRGPLPAAPPRGHRHRGKRPLVHRRAPGRPERAFRRSALAVLPEDPAVVDADLREGGIASHTARYSRERRGHERTESRLIGSPFLTLTWQRVISLTPGIDSVVP